MISAKVSYQRPAKICVPYTNMYIEGHPVHNQDRLGPVPKVETRPHHKREVREKLATEDQHAV